MEEIKKHIEEKKKTPLYITVEDKEVRKSIHEMLKGTKYRARTEYMAHGLEVRCCNVWEYSSQKGISWNGGSVQCKVCGEITFTNYDDYEDLYGEEDIRLSLYRPTSQMMIAPTHYPYKRPNNSPFNYRKHYK